MKLNPGKASHAERKRRFLPESALAFRKTTKGETSV